MNKQEAKKELDGLEIRKAQLMVIINKPEKSPEDLFRDMWFGCLLHYDEHYPDSVFMMKDGVCWFEQDFKNGWLWCRYAPVWSVFENEFGWHHEQIKAFIKSQVEERFKIKGLTPKILA